MTGEQQSTARSSLPVLDALEIHTGMLQGDRRMPWPEPPGEPPPGTPREILETMLLEPLANAPCHVAFSGGRDSSAVLAVATHVARRAGLADPIPLSARLEDYPRTRETEWQEAVVRHLGIEEWVRLPLTTELDALGPAARDALLRHGVFWPAQAHSMIVFASRAGSGSLLTGGGGDELFTGWRQPRPPLRDLARLRPRRRAAKWMGVAVLPVQAQATLMLLRRPDRLAWVRPAVRRRLRADAFKRALGRTPTYEEALEEHIESRYLEVIRGTLDTFASDCGVRLHEPFYDPVFIRAVVRHAPLDGYPSRTAAFEAHFADLLPPAVLSRETKASFTEAAWGPEARRFAAEWDGGGLDARLVDPAKLREEWNGPHPDARSITALHGAWLAAQGA